MSILFGVKFLRKNTTICARPETICSQPSLNFPYSSIVPFRNKERLRSLIKNVFILIVLSLFQFFCPAENFAFVFLRVNFFRVTKLLTFLKHSRALYFADWWEVRIHNVERRNNRKNVSPFFLLSTSLYDGYMLLFSTLLHFSSLISSFFWFLFSSFSFLFITFFSDLHRWTVS